MGLRKIPKDSLLSWWWERLIQASEARSYVMFSALGAHGLKAQKGIQGHPYNVEQDTDYLVGFEGIQKVLLQMAPTLVLNLWCFLWIQHLPSPSFLPRKTHSCHPDDDHEFSGFYHLLRASQ